MAYFDPTNPTAGSPSGPRLQGVGSNGMEPTTMMLLASLASSYLGPMLSGGGDGDKVGFTGSNKPDRLLEDAIRAIKGVGTNMESRGPAKLRATMPPPAKPVQIPGLNFQIGGGLGHDPAIDDPTMLMGRPMGGEGGAAPTQPFTQQYSRDSAPVRARMPGDAPTGRNPTGRNPAGSSSQVQYRKPKPEGM